MLISVLMWTFYSILSKKRMFWKSAYTSLPPVMGEGLENITFLNRSGCVMQLLTISFGELTSLQAPLTEPEEPTTPEEPCSWYQ